MTGEPMEEAPSVGEAHKQRRRLARARRYRGNEFRAAVLSTAEGVISQIREQTTRQLQALLATGVESIEDLFAVVENAVASADERTTACWVLSQFGDKRAASALSTALRASDSSLQAAAARSLADLGSKQSAPAILNLFRRSDSATRWQAAVALGQIRSPRSVKPLIEALTGSDDADTREAASYALGWIGDDAAAEPLLARLVDRAEHPRVRGQAAEALGYIGQFRSPPWLPEAIEALLGLLTDPSPEVRFWSVFALGLLGGPEVIPALEDVAASDNVAPSGQGCYRPVSGEARDAIASIRARQARCEDADP